MRTSMRLFTCLLFAAGIGTTSAAEVFTFWPGEGADQAAGFQERRGHPCGEVVSAQVSRLPTSSEGAFISEDVVELDARGKVIRRWPMPVDYVPRAVRGNELLVTAGHKVEKGFWVRPNGVFKSASTIPQVEDNPAFQCDLTRVFGKSMYAGCEVFVDLNSRKKRTLEYQGVCS